MGSDDDAAHGEERLNQVAGSVRAVPAGRYGQPGQLAPGQVRWHAEGGRRRPCLTFAEHPASGFPGEVPGAAGAEIEADDRPGWCLRPVLVRERPDERAQHLGQEAGVVAWLAGQIEPARYRVVAGPADQARFVHVGCGDVVPDLIT